MLCAKATTPAPSEGLSVTSDGHHQGRSHAARAGIFLNGRFAMRRVTALCVAVGIAVSALAAPAMAARRAPEAGYYVIRWNDTGVCQIWNTDLRYRPVQFFSKYKVVSALVPTFAAATDIQMKMRVARSCTL
jgi:hypothetical protein